RCSTRTIPRIPFVCASTPAGSSEDGVGEGIEDEAEDEAERKRVGERSQPAETIKIIIKINTIKQ
ncbi:MAG TPA: hypothetical protein PKL73_22850, partial [Polyangiaceae bacterium]|nr:hypothetical protein [Polyangiaceae bacterium]